MTLDDQTSQRRGFLIAMHARIAMGPYQEPWRADEISGEWLIVSCFGPACEFLTISHTRQTAPDSTSAPPGLQPDATYLGLLLPHQREADLNIASAEESRYLIVRHLPETVPVAGTFLPSDGYARITRVGGVVFVEAAGRFAHSRGSRRGLEIRRDVPDPAPEFATAMAWHISGSSRQWVGEFHPAPTDRA